MGFSVSWIGLIVLVIGGMLVMALVFGLFWWLLGLGKKDRQD